MMIYIILSTYNGAKYLAEQLDSLITQDYHPFKILIRDDGSKDETRQVLENYSTRYNFISVIYGQNVGAIQSFFELLKAVPAEANYVAFCDQDDFWAKDKISRAAKMIAVLPAQAPAMYCSRLDVVDAHLKHIFYSHVPRRGATFSSALVENIATGCSMLINQAAVKLIVNHIPDTKKILMHDWWIYLLATAFGRVVYDPEARILYRQHGANVVGLSRGFANFWARLKRFIKGGSRLRVSDQAREFNRIHGDMLSEEQKKLLETFLWSATQANIGQRIKYILNPGVFRQSRLDNFLFKILFIWHGA